MPLPTTSGPPLGSAAIDLGRGVLSCCLLALAGVGAGCMEELWWSCDSGLCEEADCSADCGSDAATTDPDAEEEDEAVCGDGLCSAPQESQASCPADCTGCAPLADVTELIGRAELFFGYSLLGTNEETLGCGDLGHAKEVAVSLTPRFTGELVVSTRHPSTRIPTVLEVREGSCDGAPLGCDDEATDAPPGSWLTVPVQAGTEYVALVETGDDVEGVFALGLHRPGVCEGQGRHEDITATLLSGERLTADTTESTASLTGTCGGGEDDPEVRFSFTAPRDGVLVATTAHPDTTFDALLHVRQGGSHSTSWCDSPETEIVCATDGAPAGLGPVARFDVSAGLGYDLFVDGDGEEGQATLTLGYEATSPAQASLEGCSHTAIQDQFAFFAEGGQAVLAHVDTVDADTAADLRLRVRLPDGAELYEADDDVECTFPPPSYGCPRYEFAATTTGLYMVEIYVGRTESCHDRSLVNYELTLTVDGASLELMLIKDQ